MKTIEEVNKARAILREKTQTPDLSYAQKALLAGMLNALVWVADGVDSSTMQRLLDGEPLVPKNPSRN